MFYHSFPRPKKCQNNIEKGLRILNNFLKSGILLVPENVTYKKDKDEKRKTPEEYILTQRRFCLTQIDIKDLKDHQTNFGPFHIEFEDAAAYDLGAVPVFYLPRSETPTSEWSLKKLPGSFIFELYELQIMFNDIKEYVKMTKNADNNDTLNLKINNRAESKPKPYSFNIKQLRDMLDMFTINFHPYSLEENDKRDVIEARMDTMLGILQSICSLFYPTDNDFKKNNGKLYYFRQREWRITSGLSVNGKPLDRMLDDDEKKVLLSLDNTFYNKKIWVANNLEQQKLVDECTILPLIAYETKPKSGKEKRKTENRPIQEYVKRIIVPKEALEESIKIAKENGFDCSKIIDFDTAMKKAKIPFEDLIDSMINNKQELQKLIEALRSNLHDSGNKDTACEAIITEQENILENLHNQLNIMSETYKKQKILLARYKQKSNFWKIFALIGIPITAVIIGFIFFSVIR
ncbi:MAG: hypothetical protein FWD13_06490 [Treponema sp.]|nr:hypothetical protein [Treponema sp.]